MWNPWKHLRLIGAVFMFATLFVDAASTRLIMLLLAFAVQYLGVIGGLDRIERLVDMLMEKEDK